LNTVSGSGTLNPRREARRRLREAFNTLLAQPWPATFHDQVRRCRDALPHGPAAGDLGHLLRRHAVHPHRTTERKFLAVALFHLADAVAAANDPRVPPSMTEDLVGLAEKMASDGLKTSGVIGSPLAGYRLIDATDLAEHLPPRQKGGRKPSAPLAATPPRRKKG